MFVERCVQFVSSGIFPETGKHCFVIAHVKPRTHDKDPISKFPYYKLWIIFEKHDVHTSIYSANCTCKGEVMRYCRHVVATNPGQKVPGHKVPGQNIPNLGNIGH